MRRLRWKANDVDGNEEFDEEVLHMRQLLKTKLVDMDLLGSCPQLFEGCRCRDFGRLGTIQQDRFAEIQKFRKEIAYRA